VVWDECDVCGVVDSEGGIIHIDAVSHATRLAIVHDRADPCRTPQRKSVMAVPKGVVVVTSTSFSDSAIHSENPSGGKPRR
jgi:hypothetical protein